MEWESYELKRTEDSLQYKFDSEGQKGRITKAVRFQHKPELGREVYNLAFGDYDEATDRIDDKIVSHNGDRERILYTIANVVIDFFKQRPLGIILIRGTTKSRIRLYQIKIGIFWTEIKTHYEVLGNYQGRWVPFERGSTMKSLSCLKKISKFIREMGSVMNQKKSKIKKNPSIRIDPDMRINDDSPFLIKKMEDAIECLRKVPLPEWVLNRHLPAKKNN